MSAPEAASPRSNSFLDQWWRVGGVLGIAYLVLFIIGIFAIGEPPSYDDDIADIRAYFEDDSDQYLVADWLIGVAIVFFFLPWAAALRGVLGAVDTSGGMWARTAFVGAILFTLLGAIASLAWGALAFGEAADVDDSTMRTLMYMDAYAFSAISFGPALLLVAASIVILRSGVFWRWLGIAGPIIALLAVVGGLWVVDGDDEGVLGILGFAALPLSGIWILLVSIQMVLRRTPYEPG